MKKLLTPLLFLLLSFVLHAKQNIIVSIAPQKLFVEKIGGDKVNVTVMVPEGNSPHTYSPKASEMKAISSANIYFTIGVEFEGVWLSKFADQNKKMLILDSSLNMPKQTIDGKEHHQCKSLHHHEEELDPHVWVDPINVKTIAKNIYEGLIRIDNNNSSFYEKNYKNYLNELDTLDQEIKEILKETPQKSTFMVFHPSWGYFAKRYHLEQLAVEIEGKEPKMKTLIRIMKKAKKEKVHAIFTQPEFSDKSARIIAKNLKIPVLKTSPLSTNWSENLKNLAHAIAGKE